MCDWSYVLKADSTPERAMFGSVCIQAVLTSDVLLVFSKARDDRQ